MEQVKQNIKTVALRLPHNGMFKPFQTWGRFSAKKITTDKGEQGIAIFFPKNEFALIMGSDNLKTFNKWKNRYTHI